MRFEGPVWRVIGSVFSWALFTFCFGLLLLGAITVMGLGGYCASGGAYVIAVECPDVVTWTMPLSIFGGLGAVAVGLILARGFGVPLVSWAWTILFVGLGAAFLIVGVIAFEFGGLMFVIIGVLFVVMGLVPLIAGLRIAPRELFLGLVNVRGEAFARTPVTRSSVFAISQRNGVPEGEALPTPADWVASWGLWLISAGFGTWAALALFIALSSNTPQ